MLGKLSVCTACLRRPLTGSSASNAWIVSRLLTAT